MATDLYARLMHEQDDPVRSIANHQFFALLREYVRNPVITQEKIMSNYGLTGDDSLLNDMFSYIDGGSTQDIKIGRVKILEDIFLIHEHSETSAFYPTRETLRNRIGI